MFVPSYSICSTCARAFVDSRGVVYWCDAQVCLLAFIYVFLKILCEAKICTDELDDAQKIDTAKERCEFQRN